MKKQAKTVDKDSNETFSGEIASPYSPLSKGNSMVDLWLVSGRTAEELEGILRVLAQEAFIARVRPTRDQIVSWKLEGYGLWGLTNHIADLTGKHVTRDTAERLWRLYTQNSEARSQQTISDFIRKLPRLLKCKLCKITEGPFHVDHTISLKMGGRDNETNLRILCESCNLKKAAKLDPSVIYIEFEEERTYQKGA